MQSLVLTLMLSSKNRIKEHLNICLIFLQLLPALNIVKLFCFLNSSQANI